MGLTTFKICSRCKKKLFPKEFYKDRRSKDGLCCYCKSCLNKHYDKDYQKQWRTKNKKHLNNWYKEYYSDEDRKLIRNCRNLTNGAIRDNRLIKPSFCEEYASSKESCSNKIEAHHEDYNKPLKVKWLCMKHHKKLHKLKKIKN